MPYTGQLLRFFGENLQKNQIFQIAVLNAKKDYQDQKYPKFSFFHWIGLNVLEILRGHVKKSELEFLRY